MRPHLCPDESCEVLRTDYSRDGFDRGNSYTCWGKMKEPHIFVAKKTEHMNDYSFCYYTPLKGHIRFFINADDAWSDFLGFAKVMDHANPSSVMGAGQSTDRPTFSPTLEMDPNFAPCARSGLVNSSGMKRRGDTIEPFIAVVKN